jgi:hypothetical protein
MVTRYNITAESRVYEDENGLFVYGSDYVATVKEMAARNGALLLRLEASQGQIRILRAQLAARNGALDAVSEFAGRLSESSEPFRLEAGEDLENLLVKHGVHS